MDDASEVVEREGVETVSDDAEEEEDAGNRWGEAEERKGIEVGEGRKVALES